MACVSENSWKRLPLTVALFSILVYVVAGKAEKLTVAHVQDGGLKLVATVPTAPGTRTVVADAQGAAYIIDPARGQLLVAPPPP